MNKCADSLINWEREREREAPFLAGVLCGYFDTSILYFVESVPTSVFRVQQRYYTYIHRLCTLAGHSSARQ